MSQSFIPSLFVATFLTSFASLLFAAKDSNHIPTDCHRVPSFFGFPMTMLVLLYSEWTQLPFSLMWQVERATQHIEYWFSVAPLTWVLKWTGLEDAFTKCQWNIGWVAHWTLFWKTVIYGSFCYTFGKNYICMGDDLKCIYGLRCISEQLWWKAVQLRL
jgi:hypothetical protein